ncbi:hypothetical protein FM120_29965 [Sphingobacterium faecium PCAi_F2.5]|jgi:hypothetical protein|nr:hypothetical protein FM120_29965 [Sphingobacterium faecium PCAi_F2.5]
MSNVATKITIISGLSFKINIYQYLPKKYQKTTKNYYVSIVIETQTINQI